jgi:trans-2,3-dihydro-3-hydroxyanthranilate isomerase
MLQVRYVRCDVFSDQVFGGNPLAVFTDARSLTTEQMQKIANEMNLSETVFVLPAEHGGTAKIRIFTPKMELPFAGHPTLGAALVLARPLQTDRLTLETRIGPVPVRIDREGANPRGAYMMLPPPKVEPVENPQLILDALGLESSESPLLRYSYGFTHFVIEVASSSIVASCQPNFAELAYLGPVGLVVCALEKPENASKGLHGAISSAKVSSVKVKARVFGPGAGVLEDPATGSAVAPIALHLQRHGGGQTVETLTISQGVELGRPSHLEAIVYAEGGQVRQIEVGGGAVVLGRGEWHLPGRTSG